MLRNVSLDVQTVDAYLYLNIMRAMTNNEERTVTGSVMYAMGDAQKRV